MKGRDEAAAPVSGSPERVLALEVGRLHFLSETWPECVI